MNETALKERIKAIAKEKGILVNVVWKQLLLERFLARLSASRHHEHFIFKGGLLLAQHIQIGRETTDIDFLMTHLKNEIPAVENAFREIAAINAGDGFQFEFLSVEQMAQPHMEYAGFRVSLQANLNKMNDRIQVDIGFGDLVDPIEDQFHPLEYKGKPIFEGEITLLTYPVETILAEKLETIVSKGSANSRMKDYHDAWLILREPGLISPRSAQSSIAATFQNRNTSLVIPIVFSPEELARLQALWAQHLTRISKFRVELGIPTSIKDVLADINQWLEGNQK